MKVPREDPTRPRVSRQQGLPRGVGSGSSRETFMVTCRLRARGGGGLVPTDVGATQVPNRSLANDFTSKTPCSGVFKTEES